MYDQIRESSTGTSRPHICVCICTYKRPVLLQRLLTDLAEQQTDGLFTLSIVVADNDRLKSAEPVVRGFTASAATSVVYVTEERQNISLARNKAIASAQGDFLAFIDDDEFPTRNWLLTLWKACEERKVAGVLGPVKPSYEQGTPLWVVKGHFYERRTYPTGFVIDGKKGRTGNVIIRKEILEGDEPPFRPQFRSSHDQDFFHRMIRQGNIFIWCDEAVVYEVVPRVRCKRSFMLRRALLSGKDAVLLPSYGRHEIAKSILAVPLYTLLLPILFLTGHHQFMMVLVKLFNHLGKLLALFGLNPIKEPYVTV